MTQKKDTSTILAIESSCDDTAAAVLKHGKILANEVANQKIHEQYGGVIPELASRAHTQNIVPVVDLALKKSKVTINEITHIAYTLGPGLKGSLMVGTHFAQAMANTLNIPFIEINHLQAHVAALYIQNPKPVFPFLCLLVSGGHTQIIKVNDYLSFEIIGETLDDAVGEAFDKGAKMLGLPYPGGPHINQLAQGGNTHFFELPKTNLPDFNFSFSGLKTALLYHLNKQKEINPNYIKENLKNICATWQHSLIQNLIRQFEKAIKQHQIKSIAISGGVSANTELRKAIEQLGIKHNCEIMIPNFEYCTDNAAMVAISAYHQIIN